MTGQPVFLPEQLLPLKDACHPLTALLQLLKSVDNILEKLPKNKNLFMQAIAR